MSLETENSKNVKNYTTRSPASTTTGNEHGKSDTNERTTTSHRRNSLLLYEATFLGSTGILLGGLGDLVFFYNPIAVGFDLAWNKAVAIQLVHAAVVFFLSTLREETATKNINKKSTITDISLDAPGSVSVPVSKNMNIHQKSPWLGRAGHCFFFGTLFYSGSIYTCIMSGAMYTEMFRGAGLGTVGNGVAAMGRLCLTAGWTLLLGVAHPNQGKCYTASCHQ